MQLYQGEKQWNYLVKKKSKEDKLFFNAYKNTYEKAEVIDATIESENHNGDFDFVVIDFETANNKLDSACSIGLVAVRGTDIVAQEHHLIRPPTDRFDQANIKIHGITL